MGWVVGGLVGWLGWLVGWLAGWLGKDIGFDYKSYRTLIGLL